MPLFSSRARAARHAAATRGGRLVETLESRCLMTVVPVAGFTPGDVTGAAGSTGGVDLTRFVDDDAATSHTVRMAFPTGSVDIRTFDTEVPGNVRNFLSYVRGGPAGDGYEGTYFHRYVADFVLQGGSFYPRGVTAQNPGEPVDETGQPVVTDEVPAGQGRSNTRGTLAFARQGGNPNSAGSGFFFNLADNSENLNFQNEGFDVFGEVTSGTTTAGQPAADPVADVLLPLAQLPTTQQVILDALVLQPNITFNATSSNPEAVSVGLLSTPGVGRLGLQFVGPVGSTSQITVTATQPGQATPVTLTFDATVTAPPNLQVTLGGADGAKSVTFTDADGTVGTVSVKGAGTATVTLAGTGLTQEAARGRVTVGGAATGVEGIVVTGGSASTAVTVAGKGGSDGVVNLAGLTSDSALRSFSARTATVTGPVTLGGPVGRLDLGDVTGATISIGETGSGTPSVVTLGTATGASITSAGGLKSVTATAFAAQGETRGTISAPIIGTITSRGDMTQNVNSTGSIRSITAAGNLTGQLTAASIGALSVRGAVSAARVTVTGAFSPAAVLLGKVTVGGGIANTIITSSGNVGAVSAASLDGVTIFAGVAGSVSPVTLPSQTADFPDPASIKSITSKGATSDVVIAAFTLGKVNLGTLATTNNGTGFGLAADTVRTVTGNIGTGRQSLRNLNTAEDVAQQTQGADLGDFRIVVV